MKQMIKEIKVNKFRLVIEINDDVVFSVFNHDGQTGGVKTLDPELQKVAKEQLEAALLQITDD